MVRWNRFGILAKTICTSIRPEFRVPTDLFRLFADTHSTKIYGPLSFILSLSTTTRPKIRSLIDLFLLFVHDHSTKIYDPLSFILSICTTLGQKLESTLIYYFFYLYTTIRPKIRVLINLFILSVHNHSTKN